MTYYITQYKMKARSCRYICIKNWKCVIVFTYVTRNKGFWTRNTGQKVTSVCDCPGRGKIGGKALIYIWTFYLERSCTIYNLKMQIFCILKNKTLIYFDEIISLKNKKYSSWYQNYNITFLSSYNDIRSIFLFKYLVLYMFLNFNLIKPTNPSWK